MRATDGAWMDGGGESDWKLKPEAERMVGHSLSWGSPDCVTSYLLTDASITCFVTQSVQ